MKEREKKILGGERKQRGIEEPGLRARRTRTFGPTLFPTLHVDAYSGSSSTGRGQSHGGRKQGWRQKMRVGLMGRCTGRAKEKDRG